MGMRGQKGEGRVLFCLSRRSCQCCVNCQCVRTSLLFKMATESRIALMKERFYSILASLKTLTNAKNTAYIEEKRYNELIEKVSMAKITARKTSRDYWLQRRYDVLTIDQKSKLIFPIKDTTSTIIYYACDSEFFDILHEAHIQIGHGGRYRMIKEVGSHYENITRKDIETYLELCEPC